MVELFALQPLFCYAAITLFGLIVGSFVNVVILRLPRMMEAEWRASAAEILGQPATADDTVRVNLSRPRSCCGNCGTPIRAIHNIPVLSFVFLRGRCAACGTAISWQYPAIEIASAAMALLVALHFGPTPFMVMALLFSWCLLALAMIDWHTQLLPDALSLPLLWLGLLISLGHNAGFALVDPATAIIGAAAGYLVLWLVFQVFLLVTGKEGMGYGDFKLLAVIGAWLGWQTLPMVLLMASLAGAVVGGALMASGQLARGKPMPFGPWLAIAGWLTLIAGDTIMDGYLTVSGLR
ncbi:prepilin peptidase [Salinisphaera aquimarina]|uniref:Prepilin leader peptidase/N-methyltransferase n=1 Tax=Salinisphaera aquimarina TaxID=2094031 RepID=A0ABV7EKN5_9GAMM